MGFIGLYRNPHFLDKRRQEAKGGQRGQRSEIRGPSVIPRPRPEVDAKEADISDLKSPAPDVFRVLYFAGRCQRENQRAIFQNRHATKPETCRHLQKLKQLSRCIDMPTLAIQL